MSELFGTRAGFGLEFHVERDPELLCVDVFIGGRHVNARDNAFYPPLLVKKLKDELARYRVPAGSPPGFTSPAAALDAAERGRYGETESAWARHAFLEWGECTDDVSAFAFPVGDLVHLACRTRDAGGPAWGTEPRRGPTVATVDRTALVEVLEHGLAVAEREWAIRLAARTE